MKLPGGVRVIHLRSVHLILLYRPHTNLGQLETSQQAPPHVLLWWFEPMGNQAMG